VRQHGNDIAGVEEPWNSKGVGADTMVALKFGRKALPPGGPLTAASKEIHDQVGNPLSSRLPGDRARQASPPTNFCF
jgi:hypothetical protein